MRVRRCNRVPARDDGDYILYWMITARRLPVLLEAVDGNGLPPLVATDAVVPTAFAFRRFLQRVLPARLEEGPQPDPLAGAKLPRLSELPEEVTRRWPAASPGLLEGERSAFVALPKVSLSASGPAGPRGGR